MPRRRCVGCGRIAPKSELMRLVAIRESVGRGALATYDERGTMPGRGAYLCRGAGPGAPSADCLALATRRGGFARALRCAVTIDSKLVESVGP